MQQQPTVVSAKAPYTFTRQPPTSPRPSGKEIEQHAVLLCRFTGTLEHPQFPSKEKEGDARRLLLRVYHWSEGELRVFIRFARENSLEMVRGELRKRRASIYDN